MVEFGKQFPGVQYGVSREYVVAPETLADVLRKSSCLKSFETLFPAFTFIEKLRHGKFRG